MAEITMKHRLTLYFSVFVLWILGGWLGSLAADRDLPVVIYTAEAATPIVSPGAELRIEYTLLRRRSCEVNSDRFIFDSQKTRFEVPDLNIRAGLATGPDHYVVPVNVKPETAPGPAIYRTITNYICNPLQRIWPIEGGVRDISFIVAKP
jgi:hypothetical protein